MRGSAGSKAVVGSVTDPARAVPGRSSDVADTALLVDPSPVGGAALGPDHGGEGEGEGEGDGDDLTVDGDQPARHSRLLPVGLTMLAVLLLLRMFVAEPVRTDGNSMEPTLHDGDALVIDTLSYRFTDPSIGDVVVAHVPSTGERVVKRVVAVAGDIIGLEDGVLVRNGRPVDEPYANHDQMAGTYWGPVEVPPGQVFLLGDNRLESVDSRHYGPVSVDDVDGRYVFRLWPF